MNITIELYDGQYVHLTDAEITNGSFQMQHWYRTRHGLSEYPPFTESGKVPEPEEVTGKLIIEFRKTFLKGIDNESPENRTSEDSKSLLEHNKSGNTPALPRRSATFNPTDWL